MTQSVRPIEAIVQLGETRWLAFDSPAHVLTAVAPEQVRPLLERIEQLTTTERLVAVGFVSYEAAAAFGLATRAPGDLPLAWFACFAPGSGRALSNPGTSSTCELRRVEPSWSPGEFASAFDKVHEAIAAGETYQANLTFQMTATLEGDPKALFADLVAAQHGRYSAYLCTGRHAVCSASPELFFERHQRVVRSRPMKGTRRRGRTTAEDMVQRRVLAESTKERAENVMIVDMVRNDLGRVADIGTVAVDALCEIERYPHVWQMTSTVSSRTSASLADLFAALHPPASITGAPKVRTMEILKTLETEPRGVYTGAVGIVHPGGDASFNVAIRTAIVELASGRVEFGVGSGIVWDSERDAEYEECLLKGAVLGKTPLPFDLIETLLWTPAEGFVLMDRHMARLVDSAGYFDRPCDEAETRRRLEAAVLGLNEATRVRLLVDASGGIRVEHRPFEATAAPLRVATASTPVCSSDVWLYHKTTVRNVYETARATRPDVDDVVLVNERGEVTESTIANVVVEIAGIRVTPPVSSGLLAGTCRAEALAKGLIVERVVRADELRQAKRVWLVNSVHGWREALFVE